MKHNANIDYKGVLLASSASISSINAIQTISAGANSITSGTAVFSNANFMNFGVSGFTVTAKTAALFGSYFPENGFCGISTQTNNLGTTASTGGSTQETISAYISPLILPYNLSYNRVQVGVSYSTSAGTASQTERWHYGLYTKNANSFSRVTSWVFNNMLSQNSTTSIIIRQYWGTDSTSNSTQSTYTNPAGLADINKILLETYSNSQSLSAGHYFLAVGYIITSGASIIGRMNRGVYFGGSQTSGAGSYFGTTVLHTYDPSLGRFTITSNGTNTANFLMPVSIATSDVNFTAQDWRVPFIIFGST